jgi:hypothetical protein
MSMAIAAIGSMGAPCSRHGRRLARSQAHR